jgi:hypothetical protein
VFGSKLAVAKDFSLNLDMDRLKQDVKSGGIYVQDNFFDHELVQAIRDDINLAQKQGYFKPSGLTNRAQSKQGFNAQDDRTVCPVLGYTGYSSDTLKTVKCHLLQLQSALAEGLGRPSLTDSTLGHELYYSSSRPGARLRRHMDEKHPELSKRGYSGASRRSISFLVYVPPSLPPFLTFFVCSFLPSIYMYICP